MYSDYKTGFGGQYGVQADRVDRSAVGWDHREQVRRSDRSRLVITPCPRYPSTRAKPSSPTSRLASVESKEKTTIVDLSAPTMSRPNLRVRA